VGRVLVTGPAVEPLTRDEVKLHLRIDPAITVEHDLVDALITAARTYVENDTSRALITQTWRTYYDRFPYLNYRDAVLSLPLLPVQSITHIKYYDESGVLVTLPATDYDIDLESGRILSGGELFWPYTQYVLNAVEVQFVAGYGATSASVPAPFKQAMKLLIGHWYENRQEVVIGTISTTMDMAVNALLSPYRQLAVA
jgi:uncharacterized phiE125 gp8 family phage protein